MMMLGVDRIRRGLRGIVLSVILLAAAPVWANLITDGALETGAGWNLGGFSIAPGGVSGKCAQGPNNNIAMFQSIPAWKLPLTPRNVTISVSRKADFGTSSYGGVWLYGFKTDANASTGGGLVGDSLDYDAVGGVLGYFGSGFWLDSTSPSSTTVSAAKYPYGLRLVADCSYRSKSGKIYIDNVSVTTGVAGASAGDAIAGKASSTIANQYEFDLTLPSSGLGINEPIWIDPEYAYGYEYALTAGQPNFSGVHLPDIGGNGSYDLYVWSPDEGWIDCGAIAAGSTHHFADLSPGTAVRRFRVLGIEPEAMVDPTLGGAFPTGVLFDSGGQAVSLTMTGLIPEPAAVALLAFGVLSLGLRPRTAFDNRKRFGDGNHGPQNGADKGPSLNRRKGHKPVISRSWS